MSATNSHIRHQRGESDWGFGLLLLAIAVVFLLFAHPDESKKSIAESLQIIFHKEATK